MLGGSWRKVQLAHLKLCASRAFWLVAYPSQGHEMLFDAHTHLLKAEGDATCVGMKLEAIPALARSAQKAGLALKSGRIDKPAGKMMIFEARAGA